MSPLFTCRPGGKTNRQKKEREGGKQQETLDNTAGIMMVRTWQGRLISPQDHRGSAFKCWNIATQGDEWREKTQGEIEKTAGTLKSYNYDRISVSLQPRHKPQITQSTAVHDPRLAVSQRHQIWPGFHGWILKHTLIVTTQQSDALGGEMSPLILFVWN